MADEHFEVLLDLKETVSEGLEDIQKSTEKVSGSLEKFQQSAERIEDELEDVSRSTEDLQVHLANLDSRLGDATRASRENTIANQAMEHALSEARNTAISHGAAMQIAAEATDEAVKKNLSLAASLELVEEQMQDVNRQKIKNSLSTLPIFGQQIAALGDAMTDALRVSPKFAESFDEMGDSFAEIVDEGGGLIETLADMGGPFRMLRGGVVELVLLLPVLIGLVTALATALGSLVAAALSAAAVFGGVLGGALMQVSRMFQDAEEGADGLMGGLGNFWDEFKSQMADALAPLEQPEFLHVLQTVLSDILTILNLFARHVTRFAEPIITVFERLRSQFWNIMPTMMAEIQKIMVALLPVLEDFASLLIHLLPQALEKFRTEGVDLVKQLFELGVAMLPLLEVFIELGTDILPNLIPSIKLMAIHIGHLADSLMMIPDVVWDAIARFITLVVIFQSMIHVGKMLRSFLISLAVTLGQAHGQAALVGLALMPLIDLFGGLSGVLKLFENSAIRAAIGLGSITFAAYRAGITMDVLITGVQQAGQALRAFIATEASAGAMTTALRAKVMAFIASLQKLAIVIVKQVVATLNLLAGRATYAGIATTEATLATQGFSAALGQLKRAAYEAAAALYAKLKATLANIKAEIVLSLQTTKTNAQLALQHLLAGNLTKALKQLKVALYGAAAAQSLLNKVMKASIIGAIIAAVIYLERKLKIFSIFAEMMIRLAKALGRILGLVPSVSSSTKEASSNIDQMAHSTEGLNSQMSELQQNTEEAQGALDKFLQKRNEIAEDKGLPKSVVGGGMGSTLGAIIGTLTAGGLIAAGVGLSSTGIGAIIGIPLILGGIAGAISEVKGNTENMTSQQERIANLLQEQNDILTQQFTDSPTNRRAQQAIAKGRRVYRRTGETTRRVQLDIPAESIRRNEELKDSIEEMNENENESEGIFASAVKKFKKAVDDFVGGEGVWDHIPSPTSGLDGLTPSDLPSPSLPSLPDLPSPSLPSTGGLMDSVSNVPDQLVSAGQGVHASATGLMPSGGGGGTSLTLDQTINVDGGGRDLEAQMRRITRDETRRALQTLRREESGMF